MLFFSVVGAGYVVFFASLAGGDVKMCRGLGQLSLYGIRQKGDSDDKVAKAKRKQTLTTDEPDPPGSTGSTRIHLVDPPPFVGSTENSCTKVPKKRLGRLLFV